VDVFAAFVTVAIGTLVSLFSRYLHDAADEVLMGLAYLILILKALPLIIILAVPDGRIMDYMSQERKEYERMRDMSGSTIGKSQMRIDLKTMTMGQMA